MTDDASAPVEAHFDPLFQLNPVMDPRSTPRRQTARVAPDRSAFEKGRSSGRVTTPDPCF